MKRCLSLAVLLAAACHSTQKAPPPLASVDLPKGADLKPYNASASNAAWPQATAQLNGRVWIALSNLTPDLLGPGGPGLLVSLVPGTGAQTVIDLGGSDEKACQDPAFVKADGGRLYVTCSGPYGGSTGQSVVEVDASAGKVLRWAQLPAGFAPSPIAITSSKIWLGDLASNRVLPLDRSTFTAGTPTPIACTASSAYLSAMLAVGSDLYVLCSAAHDGGELVRLDAATGATKGDKVPVGSSPIALAQAGDGRLAIVNSTGLTLTLVSPTASALTVQKDVLTFPNSSDLEDVHTLDQFAYVVSAGTQTLIKVDLSRAPPQIVDEVSLNPANTANSDPTRVEVLDDNTAVVADSGLGRVVGVQFGQKKAQ